MRRLLRIALLLTALAPPASAAARLVEAEGVAMVRAGDVGRARSAALADALQNALASGGLDVSSRTTVDQGVMAEDRFTTTATGRIAGYNVADEWRDGDELHVRVAANIENTSAAAAAACPAAPTTVGDMALDIDGAINPSITRPVIDQLRQALRRTFGTDPSQGFGPSPVSLAVARTTAERYYAIAYGQTNGAGVYLRPILRLTKRKIGGALLVTGQRMDAIVAVDLIDASTGAAIGRVERRASWTLAARNWEYLPADYRPALRAVAPDITPLLTGMLAEVRGQIACRPLTAKVAQARGDELVIEGDSTGLKPGDLLRVGDASVDRLNWPSAQVRAVQPGVTRAQILDPRVQAGTPATVTRLN